MVSPLTGKPMTGPKPDGAVASDVTIGAARTVLAEPAGEVRVSGTKPTGTGNSAALLGDRLGHIDHGAGDRPSVKAKPKPMPKPKSATPKPKAPSRKPSPHKSHAPEPSL